MNPASMYATYLADSELTAVCSDDRLVAHMVTFERALARVQGRLGVIPAADAEAIGRYLTDLTISPASLAAGTLQHGVPILPLLAQLRAALPASARSYLHWGATSQDVMDTATVLQCQEVIGLLTERLRQLIGQLTNLIDRYGAVPMMGRTRMQQAQPITVGQKLSSWREPLIRHQERLAQLTPRLLVVQLGGAVGNNAALGDAAEAVARALASELKLGYARPWHTERDSLAEYGSWLALLTGSLGKLGQDVLLLGQTEVGELIENKEGGGKSSAMPHKNNPVLSEALVVLARQTAQLAATQLQSLVHGSERDATAWMLEWENLPRLQVCAGTALAHALRITATLTVDSAAMAANLKRPDEPAG